MNDNFAGDRREEWQADRRVTDTTGDNRDNIHNDCWVSLAQLQYRSGTFSINLGGGGHNWLVPIVPSIDFELPS